MVQKRGRGLSLQALITVGFTLGFSAALLEVHVGKTNVVATEGQGVVIPAWYTSNSDESPVILWLFANNPSNPIQILKYMNGVSQPDQSPFKNRIQFVHDIRSKNISISINNTQETDSGHYTCNVNTNEQIGGAGNTGVINVTVLVPPSTPTCRVHGSPQVKGNITLSCLSSSGKPLPRYDWLRVAPSKLVFFAPTEDNIKGTLSLTNLTSDQSGTYVCTAMNEVGSSNCSVTFEVLEPIKTAVIVGAVVGTILGLLLIITAILVFFFYKRKKKEAQDEMANEIREDAPAPKTPTWPKSIGSDTLSRNGTLSSVNTQRDHRAYPSKSPSETASVITATGSTVGYRPSYAAPKSEALTETPSLSNQSLPLYLPPTPNGHLYSNAVPKERISHQRTNGAVPHMPRNEPVIQSGVTHSNLARMGAIPVMVPAQSQAGSLV